MRWFKHMTSSRRDEKLARLRDEFGMAGYGLWWTVLEIIGEQMDQGGKTSVAYSAKRWRNLTETYPRTFKLWLTFCHSLGLLTWESEGGLIIVDCPNLAKYRDEYTRKQGQKSGHDQDTLGRDSGTETETETEEEKSSYHPHSSSEVLPPPEILQADGTAPGRGRRGESEGKSPPGAGLRYSFDFLEFMQRYGEAPNDGAWEGWCRVCGRREFISDSVREHLDAWQQSEQWQSGYAPTAENFLRKGYWQRRPEKREKKAGAPRPTTTHQAAIEASKKTASKLVARMRQDHGGKHEEDAIDV